MAKLIFRYGAMGSSKTANALMVRYNYLEKGYVPYLLKPATDTRDGKSEIKSRIGLHAECELVSSFLERLETIDFVKETVIIIDEAQFLRPEEIPTLCWCGKKAHFNTRFSDGKIVRTGAQVMLGGNESYVALCRKHYFEGRLRGDRPHEDLTQDIAGV